MLTSKLFDSPDPAKTLNFQVGVISPLWGLYAGMASAGVAYWWLARWRQATNLEALLSAPAPEPVIEAAPEPLAELVLEPVAEVIAEPVVEPAAEAAPEPAIEVAAETVEAVVEAAPEPVAEAALEPVVEAAPRAPRKAKVKPEAEA